MFGQARLDSPGTLPHVGDRDAGNKVSWGRLLYLGLGMLKGLRLFFLFAFKQGIQTFFGFDFPLSVSATLIKQRTWQNFVLASTKRYKTTEAIQEDCH
jgi:hypothetical protein